MFGLLIHLTCLVQGIHSPDPSQRFRGILAARAKSRWSRWIQVLLCQVTRQREKMSDEQRLLQKQAEPKERKTSESQQSPETEHPNRQTNRIPNIRQPVYLPRVHRPP
ncbi:hypothetical protein VTH06DRAFT_5200 [Thermothelomyces fergusii]